VDVVIGSIAFALVILLVFILFVFLHFQKILNKTSDKIVELDKRGAVAMAGVPMSSEGQMYDNYMISFNGDQFGGNVLVGTPRESTAWVNGDSSGMPPAAETPKRAISVKPIDVIGELQRSPTNWSLNEIDDKIHILEAKKDFIQNSGAERDIKGLLLCLKNRKKCFDEYEYEPDKKMTFKTFFEQRDTTNEANIHTLTEKYIHLEFHPADIFVPELPDDAARIMIGYSDAVVALCDKKPRFYVIANAKDFSKKYESRDPILLVQSPFGFYYHILGAWDRDMIYLPEL